MNLLSPELKEWCFVWDLSQEYRSTKTRLVCISLAATPHLCDQLDTITTGCSGRLHNPDVAVSLHLQLEFVTVDNDYIPSPSVFPPVLRKVVGEGQEVEILPAPLLLHPQVGLPEAVLPAAPPTSCTSFLQQLLSPASPSSCISFLQHLLPAAPPSSWLSAPSPPAENICPWHLVELGPGQEQAELLVIGLLTDEQVVPGRTL